MKLVICDNCNNTVDAGTARMGSVQLNLNGRVEISTVMSDDLCEGCLDDFRESIGEAVDALLLRWLDQVKKNKAGRIVQVSRVGEVSE